jgi:hypothetical protein
MAIETLHWWYSKAHAEGLTLSSPFEFPRIFKIIYTVPWSDVSRGAYPAGYVLATA